MKRIVCLLLGLLLTLCGCFSADEELQEPVTFYYLRVEPRYDTADGVIAAQSVESSGHAGDLGYLLALYLSGPSDSYLRSPFPGDVAFAGAALQADTLEVALEGSFSAMTDLEITKACACLAMTCFGLTEGETVSICLSDQAESSSQTIEITRDGLMLQDLIPETT